MGCSNLKPTACGNGRKPYLTRVGCGNTIHFNGLDNETINQGIGIDLLDGVTAYDSDGDEIPFTVSPEELDKCDVGRHTVTYTATGKGTTTIPYLCGKNELEAPSCGNVTRSQDRTIVITQADDPVISGADYIEIEPNTDFNPLSGVTAVDDNGNTLVPTYSGTYYGVADGEIASFNTDISAPMKSLQVTLNPIQDLHGYDKPWVGGAGKNLFDVSYLTGQSANGVYFTAQDDGRVKASGTAVTQGWTYINRSFTLPYNGIDAGDQILLYGNAQLYVRFYDDTYAQVGSAVTRQPSNTATTTVPSSATKMEIYVYTGYTYPSAGQTVNETVEFYISKDLTFTSWTPYTNICPISGWDEVETVVSGKNLFDKTATDTDKGYVSGRYVRSTDGATVNLATASVSEYISVKGGTQYVVSPVSGSNPSVCFYDANKTFISGVAYAAETAKDFTTPSNAKYLRFSITNANLDITQLELGSTATAYEPYTATTYTTDLPQTVYGGTLDVVSGVLTVTKKISTVSRFDSSWGNRGHGFVAEVRSLGDKSLSSDSICNMFIGNPLSNANTLLQGEYIGNRSNTDNWLFVLPSTITSLSEANEWLETLPEPITLTENLATPQVIQLTPMEVQTLIGTNNVWGGNGDTKVVYLDNIPQGTFQYAENGLYEITYTAEDECGNSTTVVRQIQVGAITYRTVIYEDGTLIINESSNDIDANIEAHGSPTHIYEPLNEDGTNYVWTSEPTALWHESSAVYRIKQVEIGSEIYPTSTAFWFYDLRYCTHIDLDGIHTDNVTSMRYMFGYVGYFAEMTDVIDVSMFNTENVTDMSSMFNHCMVTSIDVSGFDTSKVTNMNRMFGYCANLERICSSGRFVIYNVTDGSNTFYDDTNLVGGNGTAYSYNYIDVSYARLDDPPNEPGYFTDCSA